MIKSFMIINRHGLPLYTKGMKAVDIDEALVGGFLSAIQSFAVDISKTNVDKIDLQGISFYYAIKDNLMSVVVADVADEIECRTYQIIAEKLGRKFQEKYSEEKIQDPYSDCFQEFDSTYELITGEVMEMLQKSHKEFISEYFVKAASDENIKGVIVFDVEKDEIIASDIPDIFSKKEFESFSSMLFAFVNRLGNALNVGVINEMLLRAKDYWIGGFRKGNLAVFMMFTQEYFGRILPDIVTSTIG